MPWYIDLLNINLDNLELRTARDRIKMYVNARSPETVRGSRKDSTSNKNRILAAQFRQPSRAGARVGRWS